MSKKIDAVELITIGIGKEDDKGNSWRLRLVQWFVDGQPKSVKLERRRFYKDSYGSPMTGKADGLSLNDLNACKPHWKKIMELMQNPPKTMPMTAPEAAEMAKEVLSGEEIPF
jgi:hypothetical protein